MIMGHHARLWTNACTYGRPIWVPTDGGEPHVPHVWDADDNRLVRHGLPTSRRRFWRQVAQSVATSRQAVGAR